MRIGLFHPSFETIGGAELLCLDHAAYLLGVGDEVSLVSFEAQPERWPRRVAGLQVQVVARRDWRDAVFGLTPAGKLVQRARRATRGLADRDVVVAHNPPCPALLGAAGLKARALWYAHEPPRSLHRRASNPNLTARADAVGEAAVDVSTRLWRATLAKDQASSARQQQLLAFDRAHVAGLDDLVANSEFTRDILAGIYGRCHREVVYPMVNFPSEVVHRQGMTRPAPAVLIHTRLNVLKNVDTVIRGFAQFHARHVEARLHVVGDGDARQALEALAAELLPAGAFTFHGYRSHGDMRPLYEACDVMALLPPDESFGLVYPEAAAHGLLLVGPDHGGPLEILDQGRLGWCIDAFAPEALCETLEQIARLSDADVDRRRAEADRACRDRYATAVIGPRLRQVLMQAMR